MDSRQHTKTPLTPPTPIPILLLQAKTKLYQWYINRNYCSTGMNKEEYGAVRCSAGEFHWMKHIYIQCWEERNEPVDQTFDWIEPDHLEPTTVTLDKLRLGIKVPFCPLQTRRTGKAARKSMRYARQSTSSEENTDANDYLSSLKISEATTPELKTGAPRGGGEERDDDERSYVVLGEEEVDWNPTTDLHTQSLERAIPEEPTRETGFPQLRNDDDEPEGRRPSSPGEWWGAITPPSEVMKYFEDPNCKFAWYKDPDEITETWEAAELVTLMRGIRLPAVLTRAPRITVHMDPYVPVSILSRKAVPERLINKIQPLPHVVARDPFGAERVAVQIPYRNKEFRTCSGWLRLNLRIQSADFPTVIFISDDEESEDLLLGMPFCREYINGYDKAKNTVLLRIRSFAHGIMPVAVTGYWDRLPRKFVVREHHVRMKAKDQGYTEEEITERLLIPGNLDYHPGRNDDATPITQ